LTSAPVRRRAERYGLGLLMKYEFDSSFVEKQRKSGISGGSGGYRRSFARLARRCDRRAPNKQRVCQGSPL